MPSQFTMTRRVAFSETDLAGIVHFANFYRYMEDAEHAFYRSLGFSVHPSEAEIGWPRVKASCDFRLPLRFEEEFEVQVLVAEVRSKAVRYRFHIWKNEPRALAAVGEMVVVCVNLTGEKMQAVAIPDFWKSQLEPAAPDLLDNAQ
ncbi:MAG: acyl-CoA thioesterase [Verrucomicrobiae bacterium]|nr:acyl-CoA thioesterase [Verrucomicrobiae bacterium]